MNIKLYFFVFSSLIPNFLYAYDPLLVVVVMVKNEQDVIVPTLKPFVDGGVDAFFIYDTGSTDNTIAQADAFLKASCVRYQICQEPFIDFATSRNRGLELACESFANAAFLLMPDAEWYIRNAKDLLQFCRDHVHESDKAYLIRLANSELDFYAPRLIRAHSDTRFYGEVHEILDYAPRTKVPAHIMFDVSPTRTGQEKSRKRWERDLEIFKKKFQENPFDPRTVYYYAQTMWCLDDLYNAYEMYQWRTQLHGWSEENFLAWYRLGRITEQLSEQNPQFTWSEAMGHYCKAYSLRPTRFEPIIRIARHYLHVGHYELCYMFAQRAVEAPYPEDDILMVEKELYNFLRYEILSECAWYLGEYEVGFSAACKAHKARPELDYVQHNLKLFCDHLSKPDPIPTN